jgi:hypothetical protein
LQEIDIEMARAMVFFDRAVAASFNTISAQSNLPEIGRKLPCTSNGAGINPLPLKRNFYNDFYASMGFVERFLLTIDTISMDVQPLLWLHQ